MKVTKVIADGLARSVLEKTHQAVEFTGAYIQADDLLIVFANALTEDSQRRSQLGGLKKLQQALAHPQSEMPRGIVILGFAPLETQYAYLKNFPEITRFVRLPGRITVTNWPPPAKSDCWQRLIQTASEEELEIRCASFRHGLDSVMAAARIYLGAAIVGHVDPDKCEATLCHLQQAASREAASVSLNSTALLNSLKHHQRFSANYEQVTRKPQKGLTVWALDDKWVEHGWKAVCDDVVRGRIRGFTNWQDLQVEMLSNGVRPDILMLDCNLGSGAQTPTGLELLNAIRSRWQEVRIIFSTAYDDAALSLTSLREGANLFFAKALNDRLNRRSLDYYTHFVELLECSDLERKIAALWRRFLATTSPTQPPRARAGLPQPLPSFEPLVRLGFYILFSLIDKNRWWRAKGKAFSDSYLFPAIANLINLGYPELKKIARSDPQQLETYLLLRGAGHGERAMHSRKLLRLLNYLLEKLAVQKPNSDNLSLAPWARTPDYWPYSPKALQTDSNHPGLPAGIDPETHEVADDQGALEFVRGIFCTPKCRHKVASVSEVLSFHKWKPSKTTFSNVAIVDDRGRESGWFEAINSFLSGCRTFTTVDELTRISPAEIDLVIQDLRLPTFEQGFGALKRVLAWDSSVPILCMSASYDSLVAIKSLKASASDFISKTLPGPRDLSGCFKFADEFRSKCRMLLSYGRSRCRAQSARMDRLRKLEFPQIFLNAPARIVALCEAALKKRNARSTNSNWLIPPAPEDWTKDLAAELTLVMHLRRQVFWLNEERVLPAEKNRLNFQRVYQIWPVDYWRWQHVLASNDTSSFVKLVAILCGIVIDRLAQWNWCLEHEAPLDKGLWGAPSGIQIAPETKKIKGSYVWDCRNEAIHPGRRPPPPPPWDQAVCDSVIEETFDAIQAFLKKWKLPSK